MNNNKKREQTMAIRQAKAKELIDQKLSYPEVARRINVSLSTVYRWFPAKEAARSRMAKADRLLESDDNVENVARCVGVSRSTIYRWSPSAQRGMPYAARLRARKELAIEMLREGKSPGEVASQLRLHISTVTKYSSEPRPEL